MAAANLSVADRLVQLLDHLKIERAHFAASMLAECRGLRGSAFRTGRVADACLSAAR